MSDDDQVSDAAESQMVAEYKDGQLQIVEVTPFGEAKESHIIPDMITSDHSHKYVQMMGEGDKGLVQLDLLNLTLVRCEDGEESYRLVANGESDSSDIPTDATVTCVLHSSDAEGDHDSSNYVVVDREAPIMYLQSTVQPVEDKQKTTQKKALTPTEILEKAKALQKAKVLMTQSPVRHGKRGRKRKGDLPPPHELLSSPNFKLFLYSCKLCNFKCNATKELTAHRASEHGSGMRYRGAITGGSAGAAGAAGAGGAAGSRGAVTLQCARCPFRGHSHTQLMKHVHEKHLTAFESNNKVSLDSAEVEAADVLVCGACGFESSSRKLFRRHIEERHGASTE